MKHSNYKGSPRKQRGLAKSTLLAIVVGIVALAGGLFAGNIFGPTKDASNALLNPDIPGGLQYPSPRELKPFSLTDYNGKVFTQDAFKTQWTVIFPGYTFCPDICPITLTILNQVKTKLQADNLADDVQVVFLSVDPARDTAERLRDYTQYFNPEFMAITGDDTALQSFTEQLGMIYASMRDSDNTTDYLVDHSASLAVINPNGQLHAVFQPEHDPTTIASGITLLKERWAAAGGS